jgi:murein DD-endopeptidase MepM/ murein hydrolase activator NlpD
VPATLAHFLVRRLLATTLTILLLPTSAHAASAEHLPVDATVFDTAERRAAPPAGDDTDAGSFPIRGKREWGRGLSGGHDGVDLLAACGTPMITPEGGTVVRSAFEGSAGNYLIVRSPEGEDHVFMHLARPARAKEGDKLDPGARIGSVGQTGNASTCHLHFEIWTAPGWYKGGKPRDPEPDLKRWDAS